MTILQKEKKAPHFAAINCDNQELLCGAWAVNTGTIWHLQLPRPSAQSSALPVHPLHIFHFNFTSVTAKDMTRIVTAAPWKQRPEALPADDEDEEKDTRYEGLFHPFDGWLTTTGAVVPFAWFLWGLSKVPSWAMMLLTTFMTRRMMAKRMAQQQGGAPGAAAPGAPAAARPAAAAGAGKPKKN